MLLYQPYCRSQRCAVIYLMAWRTWSSAAHTTCRLTHMGTWVLTYTVFGPSKTIGNIRVLKLSCLEAFFVEFVFSVGSKQTQLIACMSNGQMRVLKLNGVVLSPLVNLTVGWLISLSTKAVDEVSFFIRVEFHTDVVSRAIQAGLA